MGVSVYIPTPFRRLTGNQARVQVEAEDVAAVLSTLAERFPGIDQRLVDEEGKVHRFINIYVNSEEIGALHGLRTPLKQGDEIAIIPAISGGAHPCPAEQRR